MESQQQHLEQTVHPQPLAEDSPGEVNQSPGSPVSVSSLLFLNEEAEEEWREASTAVREATPSSFYPSSPPHASPPRIAPRLALFASPSSAITDESNHESAKSVSSVDSGFEGAAASPTGKKRSHGEAKESKRARRKSSKKISPDIPSTPVRRSSRTNRLPPARYGGSQPIYRYVDIDNVRVPTLIGEGKAPYSPEQPVLAVIPEKSRIKETYTAEAETESSSEDEDDEENEQQEEDQEKENVDDRDAAVAFPPPSPKLTIKASPFARTPEQAQRHPPPAAPSTPQTPRGVRSISNATFIDCTRSPGVSALHLTTQKNVWETTAQGRILLQPSGFKTAQKCRQYTTFSLFYGRVQVNIDPVKGDEERQPAEVHRLMASGDFLEVDIDRVYSMVNLDDKKEALVGFVLTKRQFLP